MEAGPEMDRLVAEKVMGWTYCPHWKGPGYYPGGWAIHDSRLHGHTRMENKFSPSANIAHAWEVVEKITTPSNARGAYGFPPSTHFAHWWSAAQLWALPSGDAALAICRAALMALKPEGE